MDVRFDTPFEVSGRFSADATFTKPISGRLKYVPGTTLELELAESPLTPMIAREFGYVKTIYGELTDGRQLSLFECIITNSDMRLGIGFFGTVTLSFNFALFGRHTETLESLDLKEFSLELSSLAKWTCLGSFKSVPPHEGEKVDGFDLQYRQPPDINVPMKGSFDLQISHGYTSKATITGLNLDFKGYLSVIAHDKLPLQEMRDISWQFQNLISLLVGDSLSIRSIHVKPAGDKRIAELLYRPPSKPDKPDLHPGLMMVPYPLIAERFPKMVESWFARSEQSILATNLFFGSQSQHSQVVNIKFLGAMQAAESYHRSRGAGDLYIDPKIYEKAIEEIKKHIPAVIEGDHRTSLCNRLKYGNEYSQRKWLIAMLERLPENARLRIAGDDVDRFVTRVVDTRNYYTHYDHGARHKSLSAKATYHAAERLRILVAGNMLLDVGIELEKLLAVLQNNQQFAHWMFTPLVLELEDAR